MSYFDGLPSNQIPTSPNVAQAAGAPDPLAQRSISTLANGASMNNPLSIATAPVPPSPPSDPAPTASETPAAPVPEPEEFVPEDHEAKQIQTQEAQAQAETVDVDTLLQEASQAAAQDREQAVNVDKLTISIPCSEIEKIDKFVRNLPHTDRDSLRKQLNDAASPLSMALEAERNYSNNFTGLLDGLKHVAAPEKLQRHCQGVADGRGSMAARFRDTDTVDVKGTDSVLLFSTALGGGMRRVVLWNSGITVTLRSLPIYLINRYYNTVNHDDYEYGRSFGALYYLFSDLNITQHIVEELLPVAICGSNYAHWRDRTKLLEAISFQDYPVLVWAMSAMMHPNGATVNFVCAEDNCGHVEHELVDLSKLHLLNVDLINDEMVQHFKVNRTIDDEQLAAYKKALNLAKELKFEYQDGNVTKQWVIGLRQCSLAEYLDVGREFNADLIKQAAINNDAEVSDYLSYNLLRAFKPWIDHVSLTMVTDGVPRTIRFQVDAGDESRGQTLDLIFEELRAHYPEFVDKMRDYILDTKVSHIAFYYPECPKCHKAPATSYHGYIPYDAQRNFFILALMKLLQGA